MLLAYLFALGVLVLAAWSFQPEWELLDSRTSPDGRFEATSGGPPDCMVCDLTHGVRLTELANGDEHVVLSVSNLWWEADIEWTGPSHLHITLTCGGECSARDDRYWEVITRSAPPGVTVTYAYAPDLRAGLRGKDLAQLPSVIR